MSTESGSPAAVAGLNTEVMDEAIRRIEASPHEWNQYFYRCQTGMCFAGHVAFAAGAQWAADGAEDEFDSSDYYDVITPDGDQMRVYDYAAQAMGIEPGMLAGPPGTDPGEYSLPRIVDMLFLPLNNLDDLREYVAQIKEHGTIVRRSARWYGGEEIDSLHSAREEIDSL